jgi:uncharacterized protein YkwD
MRLFQDATILLVTAIMTAAAVLPAFADTRDERSRVPAARSASKDRPEDLPVQEPMPYSLQRVVELTNRERLRAGLPALKRQRRLNDSAEWMAQDMAGHRYFDHRDSLGRDMAVRIEEFKYSGYHTLGENIAMGQRTPDEVVDGWMHSPGHRANILSRQFTEIGVGYVPPSPGNMYGYWVQDFGSRFDRCAVVVDEDSVSVRSPRIRLSIHAEDWAEQTRFSNDGVRWTDWEEYRPLREWILESGRGRRTVYIEIRRGGRVERLDTSVHLDRPGMG